MLRAKDDDDVNTPTDIVHFIAVFLLSYPFIPMSLPPLFGVWTDEGFSKATNDLNLVRVESYSFRPEKRPHARAHYGK